MDNLINDKWTCTASVITGGARTRTLIPSFCAVILRLLYDKNLYLLYVRLAPLMEYHQRGKSISSGYLIMSGSSNDN